MCLTDTRRLILVLNKQTCRGINEEAECIISLVSSVLQALAHEQPAMLK